MPALTFDDLSSPVDPGEGQTIGLSLREYKDSAGKVLPRVVIGAGRASQAGSGGALTFDDLVPETSLQKVGRYASDIGWGALSGLDKGVAGLAGLPALGILKLQEGLALATSKATGRPYEEVLAEADRDGSIRRSDLEPFTAESLHKNSGLAYEPQTLPGQYASAIGEFAPAALIPGSAAYRAGQVLAPALASETAGQLTKGSDYEGWARFGGALAGGIGAALASRPSTAARALQEQMPGGVNPQLVDQAEALMTQARQQGIDLTWPEALSQVAQRSVLTDTLRHLEAAPQTSAQMAEFFARRPQQVEQAARQQFDQIAPANQAPSTIGRDAGRAAEGEITDIRQAINATARPYYDAAALTPISAADMERVRAVPGYEIARRAIASDPQLNRYVKGLPENSVGYVNEIKKYLDQASENAAGPLNAQRNQQRAAGFGQDAALMRETGIRNSADYEIALAIQQQGREQFLQPLLDGYIGKLASRDITTQNAINALFPKNPLPNSQREIADTVGRLAQRNPRAASDLVRAHIESTFNQAAKDLQPGLNQAGGAKFRTQLVGNSQQRANLQAAVEALPNGVDRWRGFNRLLDILEATGTRQGIGSRTAYNDEFFREMGKGGITRELVKTGANPTRFLQPLTDRFERYRLGRNLDHLATILTDPNAGKLLRALAKEPVKSARAQAIAVRLVTYKSASSDNKAK